MNAKSAVLHVAVYCFVLLLSTVASQPSHAQSKGTYSSFGGSGSTWGGRWKETTYFSEIEGYAAPPEEIKKSEVDFDQQYLVAYDPPKLDTFGNRCTLSGRLKYVIGEENATAPVNWFQGISVILALESDTTPDWSVSVNREQTLVESVVLNNDGTFSATFDLRESKRNPGEAQKFQVGVAIAITRPVSASGRQNLTWSSGDPVAKESVRFITIPASAQIASEIRLIDQASKWPFEDRDGTKLIRAVNALQRLGKDKALASLRYYLENQSDPYEEDGVIVFWIIRTLFEPVDLQQRIPRPMIYVSSYTGNVKQIKSWPISPIEIVDGVPFMLGGQIMGRSGVPESPNSHIAWAEKFGAIREQPLSPKSSPIAAAEKLLRSQKFRSLPGDRKFEINMVRSQALAMLADNAIADEDFGYTDQDWKQLNKSNEASLVWDTKKQQFVPRANRNVPK